MLKPMRFCFITTFYPPFSFGGDAINVQRLARALVRRGHRVNVVHDIDAFTSLHKGPRPVALAEPEGVETIGIESGYGMLSSLTTQQCGRPLLSRGRLREILEAPGIDVIHFHNVSLVGGPGILGYGSAAKLYTAHEHWLVCPTHVLWRHRRELCTKRACFACQLSYRRPPQFWRWSGLLERELGHVDTFIALSEFSRRIHREFGFPREMELLPWFLPEVERGAGERPHARPYFLFAGRLERIKGLDDVIPLFREFTGADLLIAGSGTHEPELRRLAADIDRVRFLGWCDRATLANYQRHAAAVLVPSVCYETFGAAVIEAFQHSVPVLARNIGPLPETIEASGGGEVFTHPEELRAAMQRLLTDHAYRDQLAERAHAAFLKYWSEEAVLPRYLDLVQGAIQRRKARAG